MYKFIAVTVSVLYCFAVSPFITAESTEIPLEIRSVRVGVEGFYKNGLWTPITVEYVVEPASHTLTVETVDSDGTPVSYQKNTSPENSSGETPAIFRNKIYVKLGRQTGSITFRVQLSGSNIEKIKTIYPNGNPQKQKSAEIQFCEPVPYERPIYLIVGNEDIGLQGAIAELSLREERRPILVKVNSFADLPNQWFGYEAVEMIVLTTTEPKLFDGLTADSPQIKAIDDWIRLGGRLFFCAGQDSEKFLEKENGALRPFLPGKFERMTELRDSKPLTTFIASKRPIFMNGTADAPFIKLPYFTEPQGITFVKEIDNPLVLRCAHGFGTVIYFGGDLSGKPLGTWRDRIQLVRSILQWNTERGGGVLPRSGAMIQLGYNDISGQVRSALDRFDGVRIVPFSIILIILVAYWLIIGPFDWFLVHKILKRPVLTWISFPLWIVLFSVLAALLVSGGRPNKAMLNELDLVDVDNETGNIRLNSWSNLYSPNDAKYAFTLKGLHDDEHHDSLYDSPSLFSWNGLPGSGLGGMAPKTVSPTVWQTGSEQIFSSDQNDRVPSIQDVPVQVRSTKCFWGQNWILEHGKEKFSNLYLGSQLTDEEGVPIGYLESSKSMPPLDDCILVYGRWVQDIGTFQSGQKIEVGKKTPRRELRDLLLPKEVLEDATLRRLSFYNPQSVDLDYIVRVLSLHNILGGYEATGLYNSFQKSLDMSELLSVDRAILIGAVRNTEQTPLINAIISYKESERFDGKRLVVFRQALPMTLTALSPRLNLGRDSIERDKLEEKPKDIKGPDEYKPGF